MPTALSTVWTGLLLVVSRRKAVAQVIGFLVLENGVFVFGLLISDFMPTMVEAGVLLDLFAAVFFVFRIVPGDVAILPAGTGHQCLAQTPELVVIGAYPPSGKYNLCRGSKAEHAKALQSIPNTYGD